MACRGSGMLLSAALLLMLYTNSAVSLIQLSPLNVDPESVTVSGISSGAAMASQLHVAFSASIHGMASFAGVPYYCALGLLAEALVCMDTPGLVSVPTLISQTETHALGGSVDDPSNMAGDPVYIFAGALDTVVSPGASEKMQDYYEHYGAMITTQYGVPAEHCQPTDYYGHACSYLGDEYINNCDFDGAYEALQALYGDIQPGFGDEILAGVFDEFDQTVFVEGGDAAKESLDDVGYVYVPSRCMDGATQCRLHVALHGCVQGRYLIGDSYARNTGYLEIAELNNIVVLFPQAISLPVSNPNGCWDWWGYTSYLHYATKDGSQMKAIDGMIKTVLGA